MRYRLFRLLLSFCLFFPVVSEAADKLPAQQSAAMPSGRDIADRCDNRYPGEDSQSKLAITLKERSGNQKKTVYLRLWKDMKGKEKLVDKMILFTVYPPDAKGAAFMRFGFTKDQDKNAEQMIYLPALRKIRRVSVRDLADSFLGSDLTYGDITLRATDEDTHRLLRVDKDKKGQEYFVVESIPNERDSQYSRKISWFSKSADWEQCLKVRVDYYDRKGGFLKRQFLSWQKVDEAWVWDKVFVRNAQTFHDSFFQVSDVKINKGVHESWFTERRMRLGLQ